MGISRNKYVQIVSSQSQTAVTLYVPGAPVPPEGFVFLTGKDGSMVLTNKQGDLSLLGKEAA